jgi:hypothetical protein
MRSRAGLALARERQRERCAVDGKAADVGPAARRERRGFIQELVRPRDERSPRTGL